MKEEKSMSPHNESPVCIENRRLKAALREAIRTIEETKRSFKSKRLEKLKNQLMDMVFGESYGE